jgi:hypothetical protein
MLSLRVRRRCDGGQLTVLIIGYVAIAAVLIVVGVDVSKVFLARRALSSAADAAALAAAQGVDKAAIYRGAGGCGGLLPLEPEVATSYAESSLNDSRGSLRQTFATLDAPETGVQAGTVSVHLSGQVAVPFGRILALLVAGHDDGRVRVDVVAHAQSPLSATGGC